MRIAFFSCLLCLLFPSSGLAAESKSYSEGMSAFGQGRWEEAHELLFQAFREDPANPTVNFQLGRAAFEKRDYESAIMAFERVLVMEPEAIRAKLELARCHFELKSFETARQYFREVLETNPPDSVRENIRMFLAAMEQAEHRHFFHGLASLGYNFDSNVRTAPGLASVDITIPALGIIGTIDLTPGTGQEISDNVFTNLVYLNHAYQVPDSSLSWKSSLLDYNGFYNAADDLDLVYLGITTGPSWKLRDDLVLDASGSLNYIDLDYARYLFTAGGGVGLAWTMLPNLQWVASSMLEKKHYYQPENADKDATSSRLSLTALLALDKNRFSFSLAREFENAQVETETYVRSSWSLAYDRNLPLDFNLSLAVGYKDSQYKGLNTLFNTRRTESEQTLSGGLSRIFWKNEEKGLSLSFSLSHAYTDNDSSIPLYKYRKNLTSTGLSFSF